MRFLIVEDQAEVRQVLRRIIESLGFETDEATNRADGLAMMADDAEIGAVLLDLGLPPDEQGYSEGIAFLKEVSQRSSLTKVIVITGQAASPATLAAIEHGAHDFLLKPFDGKQLRHAIERACLFHTSQRENLVSGAKIPISLVAHAHDGQSMKRYRDEALAQVFQTMLAECNGNVSETARRLNVNREALHYHLKKHGIRCKKS
jgi:two-component system, response regulator RegA